MHHTDSHLWNGQGSIGIDYTEVGKPSLPAHTHTSEAETVEAPSNLFSKEKTNTVLWELGYKCNEESIQMFLLFLPVCIRPVLNAVHVLASSWFGHLSGWSQRTGRSLWGWWSGFWIRPVSPEGSSWWNWPCSGLGTKYVFSIGFLNKITNRLG